jgi:tetratricopeptide (TPR) repeat protein
MPERDALLERYEALGDELDFLAARPLFEQAIAAAPDAGLSNDYGYLLECHARYELRRAVELYEQAIRLDPGHDKPHYQLISARAGLQEPELAVRLYEERLRSSPGEVREHRFLATAYLRAHAYAEAAQVVEAGLRLAPDDGQLTALRGEARAGLGDSDGALADWQRALELDLDDIGALYSSAFLLEDRGRLAEAADAWLSIIEWNEAAATCCRPSGRGASSSV